MLEHSLASVRELYILVAPAHVRTRHISKSASVVQAPLFFRTAQLVHVARWRCTRPHCEHARALLKPRAEGSGLKLVPEVVRGECIRGPVLALEGTRYRAIGAGLARATACPTPTACCGRASPYPLQARRVDQHELSWP